MALSSDQSFEEEFLTCSICTCLYVDPCTLGCGHSLCRKCLHDFVKSKTATLKDKQIPCPFCRQCTPVPKPTEPIEQWSDQIKASLILRQLMDKFNCQNVDLDGEDSCFLCSEVGESTPATSQCTECDIKMCTRCSKMHLKAPSSEAHILRDLQDDSDSEYRKCPIHRGEDVKFICKGCKQAVCHTCGLQHHTQHDVVLAQSLVRDIKDSVTVKQAEVKAKLGQNKQRAAQAKSKLQLAVKAKDKTESEIKSTIEDVINLVKEKEREFLTKLDEQSGAHITELKAVVKSTTMTSQMYQQHSEFLDQIHQSESAVDVYEMYQTWQAGVDVTEDAAMNTPLTSKDEVEFSKNLRPLKKAISEMGKVRKSLSNLPTPTLLYTLTVKHPQDNNPTDPTDLTIVPYGSGYLLVVADWANVCLKSFDNDRKQVLSRLDLPGQPCRLGSRSNKVAVTVVGQFIMLVHVMPLLVVTHTLKTRKQYWGISLLDNDMMVAGTNLPACVDIITPDGEVVRSMDNRTTGIHLIKSPDYLCSISDNRILVSDWSSKSVYCLTETGHVVFTYRPTDGVTCTLDRPRGITVTSDGDIILAVEGAEKLKHLQADGTFLRDAINISKPWGLCVDPKQTLFVCVRKDSDKCIKAFSLR